MSDINLASTTIGAAGRPAAQRMGGRTIGGWLTSALRDLGYTIAVFAWSVVSFTVLVTGLSVTASLLVLVFGVVVWVGFTHLLRGMSWVDRRLAGWQRHQRLHTAYRRPDAPGFLPRLRTATTDPRTWRDLAGVGVTSVAGFALGLAAITAVGIVALLLSTPLWYWTVTDPEVVYGITNLGVLTIDTLPEALAAAALGIALTPLALLLVRGCASAHARLVARTLTSA